MIKTIYHRTVARLALTLAASTVSLTLAAVTFNEDTLAFYAFDGKTAGESAFGGTVANKVDASKYIGTVYQANVTAINAEVVAGAVASPLRSYAVTVQFLTAQVFVRCH